jgi:hypothetical protein
MRDKVVQVGKNYIMRSFIIRTLFKCRNNSVKKHESGRLLSKRSGSTKTHKILGRKYQEKTPLWRLKYRRGDTIRADVTEIWWLHGKLWTRFTWLWIRSDTSLCEQGNDLRGFVKQEVSCQFFEYTVNHWVHCNTIRVHAVSLQGK